jgi:hypothetical protein
MVVLVGLAGCAREPALAVVTGTVTLAGKALPNVHVEFWPENGAPRSTGTTDTNGQYSLTTDGQPKSGALVGPHRIVLHDLAVYSELGFRPRDDTNIRERPARFPVRYTDALQTPLRYTVVSSGNRFDIVVEAR